jgi:hypothetical protein
VQEVEGRCSEAEGGEDHPGRNDPVPRRADPGDGEEYGLNRMGVNDDNEDEDDEGNAISPPAPVPAVVPEEIIEEEAPVENGPQELDDLDDLDDPMMIQMKVALVWMSGFPKMGAMIEIESSGLSL